MKLSLLVMTPGKQEGKTLEIKLSQFVIGRDPQCHLRPASPLISKRHCAILQRDGKVFLRDFDSTNGTFVNEEQVKGEVELKHQDILRIGPLLFTVQLEKTTPVNRATPAPPTRSGTGLKKTPQPAEEKPAPAPAAASADKGKGEDDDIAAMLLEMGDDTESGGTFSSGDSVPDGSTVMELPAVGGEQAGAEKKDDKDAKKTTIGNTSSAAKAILEKYMRRPRT